MAKSNHAFYRKMYDDLAAIRPELQENQWKGVYRRLLEEVNMDRVSADRTNNGVKVDHQYPIDVEKYLSKLPLDPRNLLIVQLQDPKNTRINSWKIFIEYLLTADDDHEWFFRFLCFGLLRLTQYDVNLDEEIGEFRSYFNYKNEIWITITMVDGHYHMYEDLIKNKYHYSILGTHQFYRLTKYYPPSGPIINFFANQTSDMESCIINDDMEHFKIIKHGIYFRDIAESPNIRELMNLAIMHLRIDFVEHLANLNNKYFIREYGSGGKGDPSEDLIAHLSIKILQRFVPLSFEIFLLLDDYNLLNNKLYNIIIESVKKGDTPETKKFLKGLQENVPPRNRDETYLQSI